MAKSPKYSDTQIEVLKTYIRILKEKSGRPTYADMLAHGVARGKLRHSFKSLTVLRDEAKKYDPKAWDNIADENLFTPKRFKELRTTSRKFDTYFISTAVVGCPVDADALESVDTFCEERQGLFLSLPCADPASTAGWDLDPVLKDRQIVFDDLGLNQRIHLSTIKLSAKHIDPITSLDRVGQRDGSFIYASPKQRLKIVSTSKHEDPSALMTPGAITKPNYKTARYMSDRTAKIAEHDHVMGGVIVETDGSKTFHFRQVQFDSSGGFADLGKFYDGSDITAYPPEAFVLGDWHSGETDPVAKKSWFEVVVELGVKKLIIHDGFNGLSICHHDKKRKLTLAQRARAGKLNLWEELKQFASDINEMLELEPIEEVIIVKSNHDEFLERYLDSCDFREDPHNLEIALELALAMCRGEDPLKYGVEKAGINFPDKVRWMQRDEDYKISGVECGQHGDRNTIFSGNAMRAMEKAYGNCVGAHTHVPEILRGAWRVGTSSLLDLGYNTGLSAWMHTSCLVYPNGMRQMINTINGKWRL